MNSLPNDLRFAWRLLLKNPKFTLVAILTLAPGIGATTVIFTSINAMLLHPSSLNQNEMGLTPGVLRKPPNLYLTRMLFQG